MKKDNKFKQKDFLKEKFSDIESIAKELEENTLPLEYLVDRYEEGMKIVQEVKQFLATVEGKFINIVEQQKKELL